MAKKPGKPPKTRLPARTDGRSSDGQFAKGNAGGPGNPFGQEVNKLRSYIFCNIRKEQWDKVNGALLGKAIEGDIRAITLLYNYAFGKPMQSVDVNMTAAPITPEEARDRLRKHFGLE